MITSVSKWLRFVNLLIDFIIAKVLLINLLIFPFLYTHYLPIFDNSYKEGAVILVNVIVLFTYFFVLEVTTNMTVGKVFTQTKVADINGAKPTISQIATRSIFRLIPFEAISFFTGMGFHDEGSDTTVIKLSAVYNEIAPIIKLSKEDENKRLYAGLRKQYNPVVEQKVPEKKVTQDNENELKPKIKLSNKTWIIIGGIVLIFIITNPSLQAFKAHQGEVSYEGLKREYNFFLFSIYNDSGYNYLGIFGNFIQLS
jgi:hypothetical protein